MLLVGLCGLVAENASVLSGLVCGEEEAAKRAKKQSKAASGLLSPLPPPHNLAAQTPSGHTEQPPCKHLASDQRNQPQRLSHQLLASCPLSSPLAATPSLLLLLLLFSSSTMPIIYSLVSRSIHVLAEYTAAGLTGNFSTVSRVLLKVRPHARPRFCHAPRRVSAPTSLSHRTPFVCFACCLDSSVCLASRRFPIRTTSARTSMTSPSDPSNAAAAAAQRGAAHHAASLCSCAVHLRCSLPRCCSCVQVCVSLHGERRPLLPLHDRPGSFARLHTLASANAACVCLLLASGPI